MPLKVHKSYSVGTEVLNEDQARELHQALNKEFGDSPLQLAPAVRVTYVIDKVMALLEDSAKGGSGFIPAITELRAAFGLGLKEAKDLANQARWAYFKPDADRPVERVFVDGKEVERVPVLTDQAEAIFTVMYYHGRLLELARSSSMK